MKKIFACLLVFTMLFVGFSGTFALADSQVLVCVDGSLVEFDVPPTIINDRTMVPLRAIFEKIGAEVTWDDTTKTAHSKKGDTTVSITIGEYKLIKNGTEIAIDVPAQIVDSRTLVPVRAISESFDCEVFWEAAERIVRVVTLKLPEVTLTDADNNAVAKFGDNIVVSESEFSLYSKLLQSTDRASVIEYIKTLEAIYIYYSGKQIPNRNVINDIINTAIYENVTNPTYAATIEKYNTTDAALREYFEKLYFINCAMTYDVVGEYSDEEKLAYADEHYVRVKHILVKDEKDAQSIMKKLSEGASFEEMVKQYSVDGMDVETGYVFTYGTMVEPFEKASFALKDGQISDIVESEFGYHIIKRYPLSEVRDFILESLSGDLNYNISNKKFEQEIENIKNTLVEA